jgi:hypothetical protein
MRVNHNSSRELELCLKIDPTRLISNSIQDHTAIQKLLAIGTGLENLKTQQKTTINASKITIKTPATKIRQIVSHTFYQAPRVRNK